MQTESRVSAELTQYAAYVAAMFLTPAIGAAVLGLFRLGRWAADRALS